MKNNVNQNYSEMLNLLPQRLRAARRARGFNNMLTFVKSCDVPMSTYRTHELGLRELKVSDLYKYANILNISITWLLTGKGHPLDHEENACAEDIMIFKHFIKLERVVMKNKD